MVDFRSPREFQYDEAKELAKLDINYKNIPVNLSYFNKNTIAQFHHLLNNQKNDPILLHCSSGNRAAIMVALEKVTFKHVSVNDAITDAKQNGLTMSGAEQFIKKVIEKREK